MWKSSILKAHAHLLSYLLLPFLETEREQHAGQMECLMSEMSQVLFSIH